jgi:hypothetical protein
MRPDSPGHRNNRDHEDGDTASDQSGSEERHPIHARLTTAVRGPIRRVSQTRLKRTFTIAA